MKAVYLCLCMLAAFCFPAAALPADCSQVIVGSADGWNSSHVQLSLLEKGPRGWVMVKGPFPARLGKSGLVWGRGVSLPPAGGPVKKEGDLRSPAGIFELGGRIWNCSCAAEKAFHAVPPHYAAGHVGG